MSVSATIRNALFSHLATLSIGLPVAWPGEAYQPPAGAYLKADWLPNRTSGDFMANDSTQEHMGLLQVTVMVPSGSNAQATATGHADSIATHFARGTVIDLSGLRVRIDQPPSVAPAVIEQDRFGVPVTIRYRAFS